MAISQVLEKSELGGLDLEFRALAEDVAAYYGRFSIKVKPYHDASLPHFSRLPAQQKRTAVHYLRQTWNIIQHDVENQVDAGNNAVALWSALKFCGLVPSNDLFGFLQSDDKIEIYTLDGIQVWRNCNLMEVCSYTLEEIHSFDWNQRYDRDEVDNRAILKAIGDMLGEGKARHVTAMIPYHRVEEKFSEARLRLKVRHDHFFPLTCQDGGGVIAFLVTSKVEIVSRITTAPTAWPAKPLVLLD